MTVFSRIIMIFKLQRNQMGSNGKSRRYAGITSDQFKFGSVDLGRNVPEFKNTSGGKSPVFPKKNLNKREIIPF
jgi:hypothetical protein